MTPSIQKQGIFLFVPLTLPVFLILLTSSFDLQIHSEIPHLRLQTFIFRHKLLVLLSEAFVVFLQLFN